MHDNTITPSIGRTITLPGHLETWQDIELEDYGQLEWQPVNIRNDQYQLMPFLDEV